MQHYEQNPLPATFTMSAAAGFHLNSGDRVQVGGCSQPYHLYLHSDVGHFSGILIKPDV